MAGGASTLGEVPLPLVRVSRAKCRGRAGQHHTAKVRERYGSVTAMPDLRHLLAECSQRHNASDRCWCKEARRHALGRSATFSYAPQTDSGRPESIMRLRTAMPMAVSTYWPGSLRACRWSPGMR